MFVFFILCECRFSEMRFSFGATHHTHSLTLTLTHIVDVFLALVDFATKKGNKKTLNWFRYQIERIKMNIWLLVVFPLCSTRWRRRKKLIAIDFAILCQSARLASEEIVFLSICNDDAAVAVLFLSRCRLFAPVCGILCFSQMHNSNLLLCYFTYRLHT